MLSIYVILATALFFAFCTAIMIHQAIYSVYFRKKIALPHQFSEGIMTGYPYPVLLAVYGLLAVQFVSFIAFPISGELMLTVRLVIYAVTIVAFAIFKILTPTLLALWFGKTAFWDTKGEQGKHPFSDIYCAKVYKDKNSHVINNQQLYKISFFVKGKTAFLVPKKYYCKMTAKQIAALTAHISFKDRSAKPDVPKKALLYAICLPILIFFITLCTFFQTVATGILNSEKYVSSDTPYTHEITTVTEIGDAVSDGTKICVFYDKIGAANVYDVNGSFLYSVSLPHSVFKHTAITFSEGRLLYRYGDEVLAYRTDGVLIGSEPYTDGHAALFVNEQNAACFDSNGAYCNGITITERASVLALFTPSVIWPINMMLILALFMLRYYVTKDDHKLSVD